jgi:hypothetical protein
MSTKTATTKTAAPVSRPKATGLATAPTKVEATPAPVVTRAEPVTRVIEPTSGEDTTRFNMKSSIRNVKKAIDDLSYLSYELGKNSKLELEDGKVLTRKDLRSLKKSVTTLLDDMYVNFRNSRKKRTGSNKALLSPFFITRELVDFFYTTDLGPAYRLNETTGQYEVASKKLQDVLPERGDDSCVVNQMILNGLFTIYYRTHKLPTNAGKIRGDTDLKKYLGTAMKEIGVDPEAFNYFDFSKIRKHFKVPKEDYNAELEGFLEKEDVRGQLDDATALVNSTVSFLKAKEKERVKQETDAKRASAPKKPRAKSAKQVTSKQ